MLWQATLNDVPFKRLLILKTSDADSRPMLYYEQGYINLVWRELESRFGFPLKNWQKRFAEYCDAKRVDSVTGFYHFGHDVINPVLNEILCRRSGYPTFQKLVEYVMKRGWKFVHRWTHVINIFVLIRKQICYVATDHRLIRYYLCWCCALACAQAPPTNLPIRS